MNFKSLYLEEFCVYCFETLQDHLHYTEICCYKFLVHFVVPSLKYLMCNYWNSARSECLISVSELSGSVVEYIKPQEVNQADPKDGEL